MGYLTQQERISEIILQLKQIRKERDLSVQDIHNLVIASGGYISISSVKRVFSEGSEKLGFRYQDTIQPIVRALLSVNEETPENNDVSASEIDALKNVILLKDSIIRELRNENEALSAKNEPRDAETRAQFEELRAENQRKIEHLKSQIQFMEKQLLTKDEHLKECSSFIRRKNRIIHVLSCLLAVTLLIIVAALVMDIINPTLGFLWLH